MQSPGCNTCSLNNQNWRYDNESSNHSLLAPDIAKPNLGSFPLLWHLPLRFKSIHLCLNQFKLYFVKANVIHSHSYNYRTYTELILSCIFFLGRCDLFIVWGVTVVIVSLYFSFFQHFCGWYTSKIMLFLSNLLFFFLTHTFFTYGGPSCVGIRTAMKS